MPGCTAVSASPGGKLYMFRLAAATVPLPDLPLATAYAHSMCGVEQDRCTGRDMR